MLIKKVSRKNVEHELIAKALGIKTYFCNPYPSWGKGGVENDIRLIRRYLPKKTDFSLIANSENTARIK